jgi:hypothetical protein
MLYASLLRLLLQPRHTWARHLMCYVLFLTRIRLISAHLTARHFFFRDNCTGPFPLGIRRNISPDNGCVAIYYRISVRMTADCAKL